jgi:hypothetical protein
VGPSETVPRGKGIGIFDNVRMDVSALAMIFHSTSMSGRIPKVERRAWVGWVRKHWADIRW